MKKRRHAVNGVCNILYRRGYDKPGQYEIIFAYCADMDHHPEGLTEACVFIQKDFNKFMKWLVQQKETIS